VGDGFVAPVISFYKTQSMRLSSALTPRVVACAEEFREHIALPCGCLAALVCRAIAIRI
jgi:hypothetical protein